MIFQYGNSKAVIDENYISLYYGEKELMQLPTAGIMQYSTTRPFQMEGNDWTFVKKTDASFSYQCGDILGTLTFDGMDNALAVKVEFKNTGREEIADFAYYNEDFLKQ